MTLAAGAPPRALAVGALRRYHPHMRIRCPICNRVSDIADDAPHRPFCSSRCKTIDLGNWLGEAYRISRPLEENDDESGLPGAN